MTFNLPTINPPSEVIFAPEAIAYTDGSGKTDQTSNKRAGARVWWVRKQFQSQSLRVPKHLKQENNNIELLALHVPPSVANKFTNLEIITDSEVGKGMLTTNMQRIEDAGFIGVKNKALLRSTIAVMRQRQASTKLTLVKGHSGIEGNKKTDRLAGEGADKPTPTSGKITVIPKYLLLRGAKLSKMTQARAYKGIQETKIQDRKR